MAKRIVVMGGGISGLSAAYYLSRLPEKLVSKITLIEQSPRLGGWIQSERRKDGTVRELGPRSIRGPATPSAVNLLELVEELGLGGDVLSVKAGHAAAKNRYIYVKGNLHAIPSSPKALLRARPPFTRSLLRELVSEPWRPAQKLEDDTVHNFFTRRLGQEVADYLIDPLIRGIYAGDARQLSVRSVFPAVFNLEQKYGSLLKGAFRSKSKHRESCSDLVRRARLERWSMWTLRRGLEQLPEALRGAIEARPGAQVITDTPVSRLHVPPARPAQVTAGHETIEADHVICATDAHSLSRVLDHEGITQALGQMESCDVAVTSLEYDAGDLLPVQGFGYLVPSCEQSKALGVVFDSLVFPAHNGQHGTNRTRLTVMAGGAWFREQCGGPPASVTQDSLVMTSLETVAEHLSLWRDPVHAAAEVHQRCIPQYRVGHHKLLETIDGHVEDESLPVSLLGSSYRGVAVGDCVLEARDTVAKLFAGSSDGS